MASKLRQSCEAALWGLLAADAMSMPVHWFYNVDDIKQYYNGWLTKYVAPTDAHPSSILNLSNTTGSGRSYGKSKASNVIGSVILHDKLKYWQQSDRTTHYHRGMATGDSTLNALCAVRIMKTLKEQNSDLSPRQLREIVLEDYVRFMTTPNTHNDTYAESFHRSFFQDWIQKKSPPTSGNDILEFAEERSTRMLQNMEDSQLASIASVGMAVPWVVYYADKPVDYCINEAKEFVKLTHPCKSVMTYTEIYVKLLHGVLNGASLKSLISEALSHPALNLQNKVDKFSLRARNFPQESEDYLEVCQDAVAEFGLACYIKGSFSSFLFLTHEFHDNFEGGILANANCGGENCHRGGVLGALLGAATVHNGKEIPTHLKDGLGTGGKIMQEIDMS